MLKKHTLIAFGSKYLLKSVQRLKMKANITYSIYVHCTDLLGSGVQLYRPGSILEALSAEPCHWLPPHKWLTRRHSVDVHDNTPKQNTELITLTLKCKNNNLGKPP